MLSIGSKFSVLYRELLQVLAIGLLIGVLGGFAANFFVLGVSYIDGSINGQLVDLTVNESVIVRWLALVAAVLLIFLLKRAFSMERWYGPADTLLYVHRPGMNFPIKQGFISTGAAFISASAGASVGQYGPVLHFGASVGAYIKGLLPSRISPEVYVACGVAAAISAGFGAPIAGVIFASEAILRHFAVRALAPITVAAITSAAVTPLFFDRSSPYTTVSGALEWGSLPLFLVLGICAAVVAVLFMRSLISTLSWMKSQKHELPLMIAAATAMAFIGSLVPEALGLGTGSVNELLAGEKLPVDAIMMLMAKFIATIVCIGFGLFGGVFSPALFMGASLGYLFGSLAIAMGFSTSALAIFTVAGIAALTGSVVGAPIGMVMIVLEFTGSYEFALASMITVAMSSFISTRIFCYSFFDYQLLMRGFDLRQGRETLSLTDVSVATLSLEKRTPVGKKTEGLSLVNTLVRDQKTEAYIVDGDDKLVGRATIVSALKNKDKTADAFMENDYAYLSTDDNLQVALLTAREFVGEAIPVVDADGMFIGCLSEGDILGGTMDWQENVKGYERN